MNVLKKTIFTILVLKNELSVLSKVHFLLWLKLNGFCGWMICVYRENVKHLNGKTQAACSLMNKPILSFYVKVGDRYNLEILNQDVD